VVDETTVKSASSSAITTELISTSSTLIQQQQQQQQYGSKLPPIPTYLDESTKRVEVIHKLNEIQVY